MSIALVVTRGFGNGTLTGEIAFVVTRGYTVGTEKGLIALSGVVSADIALTSTSLDPLTLSGVVSQDITLEGC